MANWQKLINRTRTRLTREVLWTLAQTLVNAGYWVAVDNGEAEDIQATKVASKLLRQMLKCAASGDGRGNFHLLVLKSEQAAEFNKDSYNRDAQIHGWIIIAYGNEPWELTHDYTSHFKTLMEPVHKLQDQLMENYN